MYSKYTSYAIQTIDRDTEMARPLHNVIMKIRDIYSAHRQRRVISSLPLHLQYDAGLLDVRPTKGMIINDTARSLQTTLENLWLRYR